jgi:hypothetical protein
MFDNAQIEVCHRSSLRRMKTHHRALTTTCLDVRPAAMRPGHGEAGQLAGKSNTGDWQLQFDAVIWRLRRHANDGLATPAQQVATMLDCARALDQLRAMTSDDFDATGHAPCLRRPQCATPDDGEAGDGIGAGVA